jgi:hypothetical protein
LLVGFFSCLRSFFTLSSSSSKDAILLFNSCPGVLKATEGLGAWTWAC